MAARLGVKEAERMCEVRFTAVVSCVDQVRCSPDKHESLISSIRYTHARTRNDLIRKPLERHVVRRLAGFSFAVGKKTYFVDRIVSGILSFHGWLGIGWLFSKWYPVNHEGRSTGRNTIHHESKSDSLFTSHVLLSMLKEDWVEMKPKGPGSIS